MLIVLLFSACKKNDHVVIMIGKDRITKNELSEKLLNTPIEYQKYVSTTFGKKQFIDAVVREAIVKRAAKMSKINKNFEYKNTLKEFKKKQRRYYDEYKDELLLEIYIKKILNDIKVTDMDVQIYYDQNRDVFDNPRAYMIRHIVLYDLKSAKNVYEKLRNGESFEKMAKEFSQDTLSASNGGLIGPFKKGNLMPELEQVVLNLKDNEISGIIKTTYGYHIILKISEQKLKPIPFYDAKENIKKLLEKERFNIWFLREKQKLGNIKIDYNVNL
ncbi:MAG: peptidylprolyl isomerase [Endomicrobium sp.]|nr:peptidylprolyl isomerase [Endomicrobium sp.]